MVKRILFSALALTMLVSGLVVMPASKASAYHTESWNYAASMKINATIFGEVRCYFTVFDKGVYYSGEYQSDIWAQVCYYGPVGAVNPPKTDYVHLMHAVSLTKAGLPRSNSYPHEVVPANLPSGPGNQSEFYHGPGSAGGYEGGEAETMVALCDTLAGVCGYPQLF